MATTTNYGWETPDDTDLVKDGALAMRDLGQDVDTSLFSITNGKNVGMVHINTTTMSAATVANLNNVFTTGFDNYRIVITGKAVATNAIITYQNLLAGTPAASNYRFSSWYAFGTSSGVNWNSTSNSNATIGYLFAGSDDSIVMDIANPALARMTNASGFCNYSDCTFTMSGFLHTTATAYDGFRITAANNVNAIIRVYGYRNS